MNIKNIRYIALTAIFLFAACTPKWPQQTEVAQQPLCLMPNYQDGLEIPCNIAPLIFSLPDSITTAYIHVRSSSAEKVFKTDNDVCFPLKFWKQLTSYAQSGKQDTIEIRMAARGTSDIYRGYPPIRWIVLPHPIDPYLTYRLLLSIDGFNSANANGQNLMELRERNLENFDEKVLLSNDNMERNCFNCHASPDNAQKMLITLRSPSNGSLFFDQENVKRIVLPPAEKWKSSLPDSLRMPLTLVYPSWHPNKKWIAFSTSIFGIAGFMPSHRVYVDILDSACNIVLYNAQTNQITLNSALWTTSFEETWPAWSSDGKWLYFCRTAVFPPDSIRLYSEWEERIQHIYFDLCRIGFDAETGIFSDTVQTILKGSPGVSYAMPRISPDGKSMLVCRSLFNSIPYHALGDLVYVDLENLDSAPGDEATESVPTNPADILNSPDCESWHDWSRNSRWVVFGSKRQNGHYQLPYLAYFDGKRFGLPFLLPQKNPQFYRTNMRIFNLPTFAPTSLPVTPQKGSQGKNGEPHEISVVY